MIFTMRLHVMQRTVLLSQFCLSVTCVYCDKTKWCTVDILISHERAIALLFWHQQWLAGDAPFPVKFALKMTHPLRKHRLRQISAYNVSTVIRDSEKIQLWRLENRPRAFQRAINGVRTLPLSPPKGGSKTDFTVFPNKIKFQSNKVCHKVLFCINFQRQGCRTVNQLWNNRKI